MKQRKRMATLLLTLVLIVGTFPLSAGALDAPSAGMPQARPAHLEELQPLVQPQAAAAIRNNDVSAQSDTLKKDISDATVVVDSSPYYGVPVEPQVMVFYDHSQIEQGTDYTVVFENNVSVGTGTARIIGIGDYYGTICEEFQITCENTGMLLEGAYNGLATGELNDDYYYTEGLLSPGILDASINSALYHVAYYSLYHLQGDEPVLIEDYESDYGRSEDTNFIYDFSSVYTMDSAYGYETYMLVYSWMTERYEVYSGACVMYISNEAPDAETMDMEQVADDGDFRRDYFDTISEDGALNGVTWSSSNDSVAEVADGVVTWKTPGTITITAACCGLSVSREITMETQDLADAEIASASGVVYDRQTLVEGTDYVLSSAAADGITDVTVTGKGLFAGHLMRQFDTATGEAVGHTHTFNNACDAACNTCDFTRDTDHQYGTAWTKDMDGHWHACAVCGEKNDYAEHTLNADGECTVCGTLYIPGDLNQDFTVNEDDAIYLLQHVLLPDFFPVEQPVDYDHNGQINEDDAIYLLQHVLLPDFFPL